MVDPSKGLPDGGVQPSFLSGLGPRGKCEEAYPGLLRWAEPFRQQTMPWIIQLFN
jgi:hypothetical protein